MNGDWGRSCSGDVFCTAERLVSNGFTRPARLLRARSLRENSQYPGNAIALEMRRSRFTLSVSQGEMGLLNLGPGGDGGIIVIFVGEQWQIAEPVARNLNCYAALEFKSQMIWQHARQATACMTFDFQSKVAPVVNSRR